MTFFGLVTMWLAGKLIDAFLNGVDTAPAPAPVPPRPLRHPAGSRRPRVVPPPSGPRPVENAATAPRTPVQAPPWPQVVPAGLPSFPGGGWTPDTPVAPAVATRAAQLLPQLWQGGQGTFKVEQTAARWIAYQATQMGTKRGVVAYRLRQAASSSAPSSASSASSSPVGLPTLRRGSRGEEVKIVQRKLRLVADGAFGPATEAAVKEFQRSAGLVADGVVGPQTWSVLVGQVAA